jgi:hypothetical protein
MFIYFRQAPQLTHFAGQVCQLQIVSTEQGAILAGWF